MDKIKKLKDLPANERPYERFLEYGPESLSDAELLAIILKTGGKDCNSLDLARSILSGNHNNLLNLHELSYERLLEYPGIGRVKAIQLKAVVELSKRISKTQRKEQMLLSTPRSIAEYYMEELRHRKSEVLMVAFFDVKCKFLGDAILSEGSTSAAYVSQRDIIRMALDKHASLIIVLHNHPSGDPSPSKEDKHVTEVIRQAASVMGIELADHIIIGDKRYFSFREHNYL